MSEPLDLSLVRKNVRLGYSVPHGQAEALLAEYERVVTFLATKPDPSVPLSAIRALVQQWRDEADELDAATNGAWVGPDVKRACADELAALCPALPEDQP